MLLSLSFPPSYLPRIFNLNLLFLNGILFNSQHPLMTAGTKTLKGIPFKLVTQHRKDGMIIYRN